jgi:hypothetical protein
MAHVKSYSMSGPDGIYLYSNGVRIGGPYPDEDTARRESIRVSQVVGEGPIEEYMAELERGLMNEEEMRRMQMMQDNSMVPARYVPGAEQLGEYPGPFGPSGGPDPAGSQYDPNAGNIVPDESWRQDAQQRSIMQLIEAAKIQYDMLVSEGRIDPRVTPFDPMAIISNGLMAEGSGMPGDTETGAYLPPVPDEQLPFDTNMQLDPLRRRRY